MSMMKEFMHKDDWGGMLGIVGIIVIFSVFGGGLGLLLAKGAIETKKWLQSIQDPTERGCGYIAVAIVIHALVMGLKTMSHQRIKVKNEK